MTWLRRPVTWAAVVVAGLIGSIMTFSYIGGFLDPLGHLKDAPIAFVNEDAGANVAGTQLAAGQQIEQELTNNTQNGEIEWRVLKTQKEAERQIRDNEIWGAIVIPSSFSSDVGNIGVAAASGQPGTQAKVNILANEGSGLFQDSFFTELSDVAVDTASTAASQQLVGVLDQAQVTISPDAAKALGQPVVVDRTATVALPEKAGRGLAPFYLAVMIGLTGFLAASIASITVDAQRGAETVELFGREVDLGMIRGGSWPQWETKAICTTIGAALGGLAAVFTAVQILGMDVASAPKAYGLGVLGAITVGMISLVFLVLFGIVGELLGVLFTTIFGVPSALGVYPSQAIPGVFQWIASWHPLRYMTDAMRSVAFFDASGAGLGKAVTVLAIWLVGAIVVGGGAARLQNRPVRSATPRPVLQT